MTVDPKRILAVFKMTGYPFFELIEANSDPVTELGNFLGTSTFEEKVFLYKQERKFESCNSLIIVNWKIEPWHCMKMVNDLIHGWNDSQGAIWFNI